MRRKIQFIEDNEELEEYEMEGEVEKTKNQRNNFVSLNYSDRCRKGD